MARRTGLRTLRELAYRTCQFIPIWKPIIVRVYGDDHPDLIIAIEAVEAACEILVSEADEALPTGV